MLWACISTCVFSLFVLNGIVFTQNLVRGCGNAIGLWHPHQVAPAIFPQRSADRSHEYSAFLIWKHFCWSGVSFHASFYSSNRWLVLLQIGISQWIIRVDVCCVVFCNDNTNCVDLFGCFNACVSRSDHNDPNNQDQDEGKSTSTALSLCTILHEQSCKANDLRLSYCLRNMRGVAEGNVWLCDPDVKEIECYVSCRSVPTIWAPLPLFCIWILSKQSMKDTAQDCESVQEWRRNSLCPFSNSIRSLLWNVTLPTGMPNHT